MSDIEKISQALPPEYKKMADRVSELMPSIQESSQSFYKTDSQLKTVTLNVTELTDIGAAKHILARIEKKKQALTESEITIKRQLIKHKKIQKQLASAVDEDAELLELDLIEIESQVESSRNYQKGALREVAFLVEQYQLILDKLGVTYITEDMYEEDQATHHIMKAFSQALAAARARQGLIDEGNFIYFQDLGINGAAAQREVIALLEKEQELLNEGVVPTFELQYEWLKKVAAKFKDEVGRYARAKGFNPLVESALGTKRIEASESN